MVTIPTTFVSHWCEGMAQVHQVWFPSSRFQPWWLPTTIPCISIKHLPAIESSLLISYITLIKSTSTWACKSGLGIPTIQKPRISILGQFAKLPGPPFLILDMVWQTFMGAVSTTSIWFDKRILLTHSALHSTRRPISPSIADRSMNKKDKILALMRL